MHRQTMIKVRTPLKLSTVAALTAAALAGCSASLGNPVSSLFGNSAKTETSSVTPAAAPPPSTPTARALNVGAVTARAMKCGYNFDPTRLKTAYLAHETSIGTSVSDMGNLEKAYNIGFNGVNKVASTEVNYCNDRKTEQIKTDLSQLLAGNFEPPARKPEVEDDGIISGLFGGNAGSSSEGVNTRPPTANGF